MRYIISDKTIQTNLIRTANEGLLSILDNNLMHSLAYKYFGIYENGELIGYQCPYSGKIYTNPKDIILEHIIPVKSGGGTVLFNCIPASIEINSTTEKGAKHLIEWWVNSKYWDINAPKRLEKLVNYILDGYENVFTTYSIDELEETYLEYMEEDIYSYDEDFELRKSDLVSEIQARHNHINSYQGFLNDCIEQLRKSKIDVSYIENRLNAIQNKKHIFEDIERFKLFQNIIKKLIIEYIGDDNRSYLTYSLNINTKKIMDSIKYESSEQIYFELKQRLDNIVFICNQNGVSFNDYLKNLRDIEEINILYLNQNQIDEHIKEVFINNIKIGIDTKIDVFINMLSQEKYVGYCINDRGKFVPNDNNIFSKNKIPFEGYERTGGLNTSCFWSRNAPKIIKRVLILKEQAKTEEEKIKYKKAKRAIENYEFYSQLKRRIDVFIDMLSQEKYTGYCIDDRGRFVPNNNNIFGSSNKILFEGYEKTGGLNTSQFWNHNSPNIIKRLLILKEQAETEEEKIKYEKAERAIENYEFCSQLERRIDVFIDMLSKEKYTAYQDGKPNDNNIFKVTNQIPFEGYEKIGGLNTSCFWNNNSPEIIKKLLILKEQAKTEEEKIKYEKAERAIENYEFYLQLERRVDVFINMLSQKKYTGYCIDDRGRVVPNNNNIFGQLNKIPFEGYEKIGGLNTSQFWNSNSPKIIKRVLILKEQAETEEKKIKYEKAERAIENYEFCSQLERRIDVFIDMLSQGKYTEYQDGKPNENNIFGSRNKIPFEGYERTGGLNTSQFWNHNSPNIIKRLLILKEQAETEEEKIKYEKAERAIENYEFCSQLERRIDVFIDMLSKEKYTAYQDGKPNKNNIFGSRNKIPFEGYEKIGLNTSQFWSRNFPSIILRLFYSEYKDKFEYNNAREAVLTYLKVNTIEEYIDKLDKAKTKNKVLIELRNSQLNEIDRLTKENQLLSSELDNEESKRKAV